MSKKIVITLNNLKDELSELFHATMLRVNKSSSRRRYNGEMSQETLMYLFANGYIDEDDWGELYGPDDFYDDYEDYDESDVIWPPKSDTSKKGKNRNDDDAYASYWEKEEGRKKKHKHSRGKKARIIDINEPFSGEEEDRFDYLGDDNGIEDGKEIYYYPDYHDKDNRLEFETLSGFNDFCESNGYRVPDYVLNAILYRRVSHTCLMPDAREYGLYEIMAEESYGSLYYEVCSASEVEQMR